MAVLHKDPESETKLRWWPLSTSVHGRAEDAAQASSGHGLAPPQPSSGHGRALGAGATDTVRGPRAGPTQPCDSGSVHQILASPTRISREYSL